VGFKNLIRERLKKELPTIPITSVNQYLGKSLEKMKKSFLN
jgi:hypothetical protein